MKLPENLFKTYRTYKQDTDRFAQWLGSTAVASGFAAVGLRQDDDKQPGGTTTKVADSSRTPVFLRTDDFVALAKWIAKADPPIAVPPPILACATRAVLSRRKCANWFLSLANDSASNRDQIPGQSPLNQQNHSHLHFISVLESVISILSPLASSSRKTTRGRSSASLCKRRPTPIHSNTFWPLAADRDQVNPGASSSDDDDDGGHGGHGHGPSAAHATQQQYRMEDEREDVNLIFIIHSYYADFHQVREFVKDTWMQYRDGKIDLSTASLTTSCAVDLVREAQTDLYAAFPAFNSKTCVSLILLVYIQACLLRKEHPFSTDAYVKYNEATHDLADFLMIHPAHLAMEFANFYHKMPGHQLDLPAFFSNTFDEWGKYDPLVDRSRLSARDQYHEDSALLMSISSFLHGLAVMDELPYPYLDAFTLELSQLTAIWRAKGMCCEPIVAFTSQVFFDIHHLLRERACFGFNDLQSTAKSIITSLDAFDAKQYGKKDIHKNLTAGMGELRGMIHAVVLDDPFASIAGQPPQFKLLKSHPWLCGLLQYRLLYIYQAWAISAAIHWGSVPNSCHLYEAAKREGYIGSQDTWADMEFVMQMHTKEGMFRGRIPSNRIEAFNALQLIRGASAVQVSLATREMIAGGGRFRRKAGQNATLVTNRGEDHRPPEPCPLTLWIDAWMESCTRVRDPFLAHRAELGLLDISRRRHHTHYPHLQSLDKFNSKAKSTSASSSPPSSLLINPHTSQPYFVFDSDGDGLPDTGPRSTCNRKLAPLVLLSSLRDALHRESAFLQFDYWGFHLQCVRLHYALTSAAQPFLSTISLDRLHSSPVTVSDVIPNVFHFCSPIMRPCHPKSPEFAECDTVLRVLFDALVKFMRTEGNVQVEAMRKRAKYVALRAQVPAKDRRPPDQLWHPFAADVVDQMQQKWDRDVTPMEGLDPKLMDMVKNMDTMDFAAMKLTVPVTMRSQRSTPPRAARPIR